ncbi:MAG TPA: hypothetical protein VFU21_18730 [Kofleriaceae bacterium]|nr:hypothetical protein [Kofleriaceae bacterium]
MAATSIGCLAAPPSSTAAPDADGGVGAGLIMNGVGGRDGITLDSRDELVLAGVRDAGGNPTPIAVILEGGDGGLAAITGRVADLPFLPIAGTVVRWTDEYGVFVALGPAGDLIAIDIAGRVTPIEVVGDAAGLPFEHVAEIGAASRHLLLTAGARMFATEALDDTIPGAALDSTLVGQSASDIVFVAGYDGNPNAIGEVEDGGQLSVFLFDSASTTIGEDLVADAITPPLGEARWTVWDSFWMHLVALGPSPGQVFWHRTPLDTGVPALTAIDLDEPALRDVDVTSVDGDGLDVIFLVERGEEVAVQIYLDPIAGESAVFTNPIEVPVPLAAAEPGPWLHAMDAVDDGGVPGINEIIVHDRDGRAVCVDYDEGAVGLCGEVDLAAFLD